MLRIHSISIIASLLAAGAWGCGGSSNGNGGDGDGGVNLAPPAECALSERPAGWVYPSGPYGQEVGDILEDFTLEDCDGNDVNFGDILSQSEMTLFNIGAGWCLPCIEESETIIEDIFEPFCGRGLRIVQVLFQDEQSRPATSLFCDDWRNGFTLSFPVLKDPLFKTMKYFESVQSQTPINFLVDQDGKILFKKTGAPPTELPQVIDDLLPK